MEYLIVILQFILSLSILVTLHEFGHFLPARWFGMRVEKFYLFFNPWFSIYKVQRGETEWGLGWLPLGGYVKIAGMIDESMDTEAMNQPPQEWEFRSKPAWQRLVVMLGGVTVNFILGFFIMSMLLWIYGEKYLPTQNLTNGIAISQIGQEMGLKNGDKLLAIGDKEMPNFNPRFLLKEIVINMATKIKVQRDGKDTIIVVPDSVANKLASNKNQQLFCAPRVPVVVAEISKKSPADSAKIQKGDSIIACNGIPTQYFDEFQQEVVRHKSEKISITLIREGKPVNVDLVTTDKGMVGIAPYGAERYYTYETKKYSLLAAIPAGIANGWDFLITNIKALGQMVTGSGRVNASESLGGFYSIAKLFPTEWIWERFWYMTAILSLILGFMNLLPIPALDGGHAVFLLIEIVMRRPVPQKVMEYAQVVGFVLLIGLLLFANGMDLIRYIRGE